MARLEQTSVHVYIVFSQKHGVQRKLQISKDEILANWFIYMYTLHLLDELLIWCAKNGILYQDSKTISISYLMLLVLLHDIPFLAYNILFLFVIKWFAAEEAGDRRRCRLLHWASKSCMNFPLYLLHVQVQRPICCNDSHISMYMLYKTVTIKLIVMHFSNGLSPLSSIGKHSSKLYYFTVSGSSFTCNLFLLENDGYENKFNCFMFPCGLW
jgi:hypothetical protein